MNAPALPFATTDRSEPLSPFVAWSPEERAPLPAGGLERRQEAELVLDLLSSAEATVGRMMDARRLRALVSTALLCIVSCTGGFSLFMLPTLDLRARMLGALLTAAGFLCAMAASFAPIYGASILVGARLPMVRLVAALTTCTATAALLLAAQTPLVCAAWKVDREWWGPASVVLAFVLASCAGAKRLHSVLRELARRARGTSGDGLTVADELRVGIVARVSTVLLGFTLSMAVWAAQMVLAR